MQLRITERSTVAVDEEDGDVVLSVRAGTIPDQDLRAIRAALAHVTGRVVRRPTR
jgi:tRNA threonylcarbamoyladenosine modification (KEOPS) complex  Pcc1 subunit